MPYDNLSIYINVIYDNYIFRNSRVCSRHFCAGVPNYIHPVPTITMGYTISTKPICGRRPQKERANIVNEQEIKIIEKESHTDEHCYLGKVTIPVKTKKCYSQLHNSRHKVTVNTLLLDRQDQQEN